MKRLLLSWFATASLMVSTHGQIGVGGIADKTVYNDQVAFTVTNVPGYIYDARLDGVFVPVGSTVVVKAVEYHELSANCTNTTTGLGTNQLVRFIVASTERNGTENGIPPWTPYPMIPSSDEETSEAHIRLMAPQSYPDGMAIPVVAWIENDSGGPVRVNGPLTATGQPSIQIRRGVGSGFIVHTSGSGPLPYASRLSALSTNLTIAIENNTVWTSLSGVLSGTVAWPADSHIAIVGDLAVPPGATLTVDSGTIVRVDSAKNIIVGGHLVVLGTPDRPVVFTPTARSQPWGGIFLTNNTSLLEASSTIFTGSGANPNGVPDSHRHEQCLFFCDNHAKLSLTNCAAIDLAGQFGHGVDRGQPWNSITIVRTLIQRCTTGGEWNGCSLKFLESALLETPYETPVFNDGDEDGIYFTTGTYEVRDSLISWTRDDGIDSGSGGAGTVTVSNTWVESTFHEGFAWSGANRITTNLHTVCLNCGQGIECGWSSSAASPYDFVDDCLSTANLVGGRFGDNYDWTYSGLLRITNSLLLYNHRDLWGRNWQDWTYRASTMDIQGNLITAPNAYHSNNSIWDPARDGGHLASFMTTPPSGAVGVGLAVRANQFDLATLTNPVPVRLSSFTANQVSVDYSLEAPGTTLASGTLEFAPGQTLKFITLAPSAFQGYNLLRLRLQSPLHAQITGQSQAWFVRTVAATNTTLVPTGAVWRYLDTGINAGTAWREPGFDDSSWPQGRAELGYGDSKDGRPETTVIGYGPDANNKYITYYFRFGFPVTNIASWGGLTVQLKRDDGGIVYLNGEEIFRSNIADGPVDYLTRASLATDDGTAFYSVNAPASLLVEGSNMIAVEIHQESPTSSDISFDLQLSALPALTLHSTRFGPDLLLLWDDPSALLEGADDLSGPWPGIESSSPIVLNPSGSRKFYRLQKP